MKKDNKGFSLVELIVVVAIMAVLMTILAPQLLKYVESSRAQKDESAAEEIRHQVEIAITNEDIYNDLGLTVAAGATEATATLTAADDTAFDFSGSGTKLESELATVLGTSKVDFTSTEHNGQKYVITIKYTAATKGISVTGEFQNP